MIAGAYVGSRQLLAGTRRLIDADIVIGADGLHSTIAERVGAARIVEGRHSTGTLYSYWQEMPVDGYHWWFRTGGSVGAIPTNNKAACVFVTMPAERFRDEVRGDPFIWPTGG